MRKVRISVEMVFRSSYTDEIKQCRKALEHMISLIRGKCTWELKDFNDNNKTIRAARVLSSEMNMKHIGKNLSRVIKAGNDAKWMTNQIVTVKLQEESENE